MPQNQDEQPYPGQPYNSPGPAMPQRSSDNGERGRQYPPVGADLSRPGPYAPQSPARSAGTYPPQPTPGVAGPYPPQPSPAPGGSYPQQTPPRQHSPASLTPPQLQGAPGQLVLGSSSREEPLLEAAPVVRHARSRSPSAVFFNAPQEGEEPMGMIDYALILVVVFLLVAVIIVFWVIFSGALNPHNDTGNIITRLLIGIVLYAGCVFGGYLWGRYQADTEAKRENVVLRQNIDMQQNELDRLRNEVRSLRAAAGAQQAYQQNAPRDYQSGRGPAVVAPRQIERQQPVARIYDQEIDPEGYSEQDRRDFPHEKSIPSDGSALDVAGGWRVVGASRRGYGHAYGGSYREDDFNVVSQSGVVLVAIADGVSAKAASRFGAQAAVLGATRFAEAATFMQELSSRRGKPDCENIARKILFRSLDSASASIQQQAQMRNLAVDDLQSTLLVFLAAPLSQRRLLVASVQVGDGALFACEPERGHAPREQWSFLQHPQIQASGNEVQPFMTSSPDLWEQVMSVKTLDNPAVIMGMTDGTADDIEPPPRPTQNLDADPFFLVDDFYRHIQTDALHSGLPGAGLLKFLSYKKKGSTDDRTVVCLYR
jgi:hypothetical protein